MTSREPFFKPVPQWDMQTARTFLDEHTIDDYELIDVRQPDEFEGAHLPGAKLIPLSEISQRMGEIARDKPALIYCRSGGRAGNAVAQLAQAGYEQAYNIGGIMQWDGAEAVGAPEAGMAWFDGARDATEYVALAWMLEENARLFYLELAKRFPDRAAMFEAMSKGEDQHKAVLSKLHRELTGTDNEPTPPAELSGKDVMEGGLGKAEALSWIQRGAVDALELTAAMEANAYDRYIRVGQGLGGDSQRVFKELAEAEKVHLNQLMKALSSALKG